MPELTPEQMRGIELTLEQQDRFMSFAQSRHVGKPMDLIVREFYETARGANFEMMILNKIGLLLAPESTEDLTYTVQL